VLAWDARRKDHTVSESLVHERDLQLPGFRGTLLRPGDEGYDEARRVFNGMVDRCPALIARCTCAEDVVAAVNLARQRSLPLSVYGGGHGVTGSAMCVNGVCIDLRGMKKIEVDPHSRTCRAGGGLTWGELDAATQVVGLAVTGGRVSATGVAGLALGSGSGWLERKYGFTCDNLLSAEVVTADGRTVVASENENADLFWGLRGGGGNFGVVTEFHFRLHEVGPVVLGGMLMFAKDRAVDVVRTFRDFMAQAPDEVGGAVAFVTAPPEEFVPEAVRGTPVVVVPLFYVGPIEDGERVLAPLRENAAVDLVQPMPYVSMQRLIDPGNPKGMQNYWTADFLAGLPDEAVDVLVAQGTAPVSPMTQVVLFPGGGAISRVDDDAMAFGHRRAAWNVHYLSMWPDPADNDRNIAYTKAISAALKPWTTGGAYLNFLGDEGTARIRAAFGPQKYARLVEIKRAWDPNNLFRLNQNIPPDD
jgi:FAD/FMN-containing dehydrogenase